jgi:ribose transport system ATP-binding protein
MTVPPALALRSIVKHFGGVKALAGASLIVERGETHGLIGQNGAGKSTLIKVLAGIHAPDSGVVEIDGVSQPHLTPAKIERLGVHFIHQDRLLPPTLTVAEALFVGKEPRLWGGPLIDRRRLRREAREALKRSFDIDLPVDTLIRDLTTAEQQVVQITRALLNRPTLLVFDEPTAALVRREAELLFSTIERLRADGLTVLYISHYLSEIERLCHRVTVLRNGAAVATVSARATTTATLVSLMIDRKMDAMFPSRKPRLGAPVLATESLGRESEFDDVSIVLRRGEILGVTGLVGSGAKAFARALFGVEKPTAGRIAIDGETLRAGSPAAAVAGGVALVPEDRRANGVSLDLTISENATLASLKAFSRFGFLNPRRERQVVADAIAKLDTLAPGVETPVGALSGGNQQKVALSKWLIRRSKVVIFDEPTVGVDVAAKADIYREIGALADSGVGVLIVSSDLTELVGLADRVLVFFRGAIVADVAAGEVDQDRLLTLVTTGRDEKDRDQEDEKARRVFAA